MGANDVTAMLPCPFCGSKDDLGVFHESYLTGDSGDDGYRAACDFVRSGCGARSIWCATEADAVAAWNRRAHAHQGAEPAPGVVEAAARVSVKAYKEWCRSRASWMDDWMDAMTKLEEALSAPAQGSPQEEGALECLGRLERFLSSEGFRMEPEIAKIRRALSTAGRRDA